MQPCSPLLPPANFTEKQHTAGHLNCPACAQALSMLVTPLCASMSFNQAADSFLGSRAPSENGRIRRVAPRTYEGYREEMTMLRQFFGAMRLNEIHAGHLFTYQNDRASGIGFQRRVGGTRKGFTLATTSAGAGRINGELGTLRRIMELAQAWTPQLSATYERLQEPENDTPRALSPEEQERFLELAAANPDWNVVWWYALVVLCTTFSSDEMRTVRQGDINLTYQTITVNPKFGKNTMRRREVTINDPSCLFALERLIERSIHLGGKAPERFLFPLRLARGHYDGERPISRTGLRKNFEAVRAAAGVPWFTINGLRHTAITRMAESGIYWPIIQKRAGHVTAKMTWHYTHIAEQVERAAMQAHSDKRKPVVSITQAQLRRNLA